MSGETDQAQYQLHIDQFLSRFRNSKKLDDLFSRGYTICLDSHTNQRTILKFYSIETADQEQAVLENLLNFTKLNRIPGICRLISYAVAESNTELISAFEYDPLTFGEYLKIIKSENISRHHRLLIYLDVLHEVAKIIGTGVQIGIQMDDINRQTIIVKQNPLKNALFRSSSSNLQVESSHSISIFYDEREKEYNKIEEKIGHLNNNKIYWSAEKIENQAIKGVEYSTQQGQEPIYQLGLMMLDSIYQIQSHHHDSKTPEQNQLRPDEVALHSENPLSYYIFDKQLKSVHRNELLVTHRLNYLFTAEEEVLKHFVLLIKSMIGSMAEARPDLNKIISEVKRLQDRLKANTQPKAETPVKNLQNNAEPLRSMESIGEEPIHLSIAQTVRNYDPNKPSTILDSLKYSESSLPFYQEHKSIENAFKKGNSSPSPIPYRKEGSNPMSATTITSDATNKLIGGTSGYESNKNAMDYESSKQDAGTRLRESIPNIFNQILDNCKAHSEGLRNNLLAVLQQIHSIQRVSPNSVMKKEYLDQSIYYGCVDGNAKREGLGVYLYKTGDTYFGVWEANTLNQGTYLFKNGESFEGSVKGGKQGLGIYRYLNGNVYEGNWKDDLKNGGGKMKYPSGAKYQGEWLKGKKHGSGIYYYQNGIQYNGGFALGKKYGNGVFIFPNGTKVEGFWDNNHLQGLAKIYYQNGDYYEGNLHMSQKTGEGVYRWNNVEQGQIEYKGEFNKDNLDGFATIKFKRGQIYEGRIKNGKRDGQGTYRYSNGDEFKGEWKNDQKQIGRYVFSTGDQFEGKFKQGQMAFGTLKYQNGEIYQGEFYKGQRNGVGTYSNKIGQLVYEGHWERDEYVGPSKS